MTLFDLSRFSEIKNPEWNANTLKPPLKIKEILLDFKIQWSSYCHSNIRFLKRIKFLILRVFQRFAYNIGWIYSTRKYNKMINNRGKT